MALLEQCLPKPISIASPIPKKIQSNSRTYVISPIRQSLKGWLVKSWRMPASCPCKAATLHDRCHFGYWSLSVAGLYKLLKILKLIFLDCNCKSPAKVWIGNSPALQVGFEPSFLFCIWWADEAVSVKRDAGGGCFNSSARVQRFQRLMIWGDGGISGLFPSPCRHHSRHRKRNEEVGQLYTVR